MWTLEEVLTSIVSVSAGITAIQIYLQVNKIWKRKHEKEVAESQSIVGLFLLGITCITSMSYYYYVQQDWPSLIETSFYLFQAIIFGMISTGFWVKGRRKYLSLWALTKNALRLERKEANYLINKMFKPTNAGIIINILHQIAMIDDHLDPKEQELIEAFAKEWNIDYSVEDLNEDRSTNQGSNFMKLRNSVGDYLKTDPPKEQAAQLKDMMYALIHVDDEISDEEELISQELLGQISSYVEESSNNIQFDVLIVPQSADQQEFIKRMMPESKEFEVAGGKAFSMGSFYSKSFASKICEQYRDINLFTIVHTNNIEE